MNMDYMKLAADKTIEGMDNNMGGPFGAILYAAMKLLPYAATA